MMVMNVLLTDATVKKGCEHFPVDKRDNPACENWEAPHCSSDADCADDNACTENVCSNGNCHVTATNCDDGDHCTVDSCHPESGCSNEVIAHCKPDMGDKVEDDVEIESMTNEEFTSEIGSELAQNNTPHDSSVLGAGPIAGIAVGVVALIAVISMVGYKMSQKTVVPDNAYKAM